MYWLRLDVPNDFDDEKTKTRARPLSAKKTGKQRGQRPPGFPKKPLEEMKKQEINNSALKGGVYAGKQQRTTCLSGVVDPVKAYQSKQQFLQSST
jgi:hypothetical protein